MSILQAKTLSLKKGTKYILHNIDWQIEKGDCWLVYGLNGCGKTTLLSILAGYQSGSEGKVLFEGEEITRSNAERLRKEIGWDSASFLEQYIKRENVLDIVLAGKMGTLGISEAVADIDLRKAKRLLTDLGLRKNMRYPYDLLSCGQKQRVLLARALMSEGEILILDEPCSGLDVLSKAKVLYELESLSQKEHKTIIYVTHHFDEILPIFNKALLLKAGQVHSLGDRKDVFSNRNFSDFLGVSAEIIHTDNRLSIALDMSGVSLDQ